MMNIRYKHLILRSWICIKDVCELNDGGFSLRGDQNVTFDCLKMSSYSSNIEQEHAQYL